MLAILIAISLLMSKTENRQTEELSIGPFFMTRPNPTRQPSGPIHRKLKHLDQIQPNFGLYRVPVNKNHNI